MKKLDWTRLLGFDQIADQQQTAARRATLGSKVGGKIGDKAGIKGR